MYTRRSLVLGRLAVGVLPARDAQRTIQVTGAVKQALTLSAEDLAEMLRASVRTTNNGMETVYEGVWLHEVLKKAGVPQVSELRGKALAAMCSPKRKTDIKLCSPSANSIRRLSTTRFRLRIRRMASRCSARRDGFVWWCRRTNLELASSEC